MHFIFCRNLVHHFVTKKLGKFNSLFLTVLCFNHCPKLKLSITFEKNNVGFVSGTLVLQSEANMDSPE